MANNYKVDSFEITIDFDKKEWAHGPISEHKRIEENTDSFVKSSANSKEALHKMLCLNHGPTIAWMAFLGIDSIMHRRGPTMPRSLKEGPDLNEQMKTQARNDRKEWA